MALIIDNTISNKDVSIKENLGEGIKELSKLINTSIAVINLAAVSAIAEMTDIRYNTNTGIIHPNNTQSK